MIRVRHLTTLQSHKVLTILLQFFRTGNFSLSEHTVRADVLVSWNRSGPFRAISGNFPADGSSRG